MFTNASDKVFGPTTTTRQVYDVAAQHVINGAMEGINGNCQKTYLLIVCIFFNLSNVLLIFLES